MERDRRIVLLTGCSSGFGHAMVPAFLDQGWTVVATVRRMAERPALFDEELARHANRLSVLSLDVTRDDERRAAAAHVSDRWGRLDCLVSNAGQALFGALEDIAPEQLRAHLEVNFLGAALVTRELLPLLRRARGRVIAVSSLFGTVGFPLTSAYCAGKFALEGLLAALREELRPHGVRVTVVEPGRHRTGFGTRATWGVGSFSPGSPYAPQSAAYLALVRTLAASPGAPPERVARVVAGLAARSRIPGRVRVGRDARLLHVVSRILPERLAASAWAMLCARAIHRAPVSIEEAEAMP